MYGSATIFLVDAGPKASLGGPLSLLGLCRALSFFLPLRRYRLTRDFLVNKPHAKGYLPALAKQVTKAFQVLIKQVPFDLQLLVSFSQAAPTVPFDGYLDDRFFARIF
jgi:hypothetical protein